MNLRQDITRDVIGKSYLFFAISARLPLLALFVASATAMLFVCAVAYTTIPAVAITIVSVAFVLMFLEYIVLGLCSLFSILYVCGTWLKQVMYAGSSSVRSVFTDFGQILMHLMQS